ncbi:hypothetical protein EVG20_g9921 [Dentipellis fragilis]|uniref:Uncharacterized protein n=1 Tax=Dentipellis fragilis TaxID=205917 RepID=A0A4Y9XUV2_9AGAM|nr:hypothetical protein EVG20_g9921 [Dentipellis fragilis]
MTPSTIVPQGCARLDPRSSEVIVYGNEEAPPASTLGDGDRSRGSRNSTTRLAHRSRYVPRLSSPPTSTRSRLSRRRQSRTPLPATRFSAEDGSWPAHSFDEQLPASVPGTDRVDISFRAQIGSSNLEDGVCLADMLDHEIRTQILCNMDAIVLRSHTRRIRICIAWPGYKTRLYSLPLPSGDSTIAGRDQRYQCRRSYLVKGLVKAFKRHIHVAEPDADENSLAGNSQWRLGPGAIGLDRIILHALIELPENEQGKQEWQTILSCPIDDFDNALLQNIARRGDVGKTARELLHATACAFYLVSNRYGEALQQLCGVSPGLASHLLRSHDCRPLAHTGVSVCALLLWSPPCTADLEISLHQLHLPREYKAHALDHPRSRGRVKRLRSPLRTGPAVAMVFPLDRAVLAALFAECIMYGMCMTMGVVTTLVFLRSRAEGGLMHKRLLGALLLMLVLATAHVIIALIRAFEGFILFRNRFPGGPSEFFANIGDRVFIGKMSVFILQTVLGDSVNIWRCYVVYGKKKSAIILPIVLMVSGFICACMILNTQEESRHAAPNSSVFGVPSRWIKPFHLLMLVTVLYCNIAIAWKIYSSGNFNTSLHRLFPVLLAIIETGVIYTSSLLAFLGTYFADSNGQYIAVDVICPLVPIIFCLLILQVKFYRVGHSMDDISTLTTSRTSKSRSQSSRSIGMLGLKFRKDANTSVALSTVPVTPVAIHISTQEEGAEETGAEDESSSQKAHRSDDPVDNSV